MGLWDRDWYREDLNERLRRIPGTTQSKLADLTWSDKLADLTWEQTEQRQRPVPMRRLNRGFWLTGTMLAVVAGIVVAAPPILTSRCDQMAWQMQPIRCWQYSWQAWVAGNRLPTVR